jgi:hypothetical protein
MPRKKETPAESLSKMITLRLVKEGLLDAARTTRNLVGKNI